MNAQIKVAVAGLVVIASLAGASIAAVQPDVAIRYRWTKGEALRYRTTQQSTTTMSGLPGGLGDMSAEHTIGQVFVGVVRDIAADGTTTLEQVIESVKMTMTSPMGSLTFDSANAAPSGNPMDQGVANIMSAMVGEPFTVVMSAAGAVQKVEGFSRIFDRMLKFLPQDPRGAATMNAVKQGFSDEAVLNMMAQGFAQLPSRPVKVGESWSNQITMRNPVMGGFTTAIASTLKAVDGSAADQVANIALELTFKQDPSAPAAANPMGMSLQIGDGTGEGEILFDVTRGRLLRSTTRMTMPMTMSGPGPDGSPMSMKSMIKSTTTVELIQQ